MKNLANTCTSKTRISACGKALLSLSAATRPDIPAPMTTKSTSDIVIERGLFTTAKLFSLNCREIAY